MIRFTIPKVLIGALLIGSLLAGCASNVSPPSTYLLPSAASAGSSAAASVSGNAPLLAIRAIHLAPFLEVKGIVFQLDDVRLQEASNHQWAEPLGAVIERGIRDRLADRLPQGRVMLNRDINADTPALSLQVEVDQFQGLHTGYAAVSGQWQLSDSANRTLVQRRFDIQVPLASDGYPALVRALSSGLDQLSDEISTHSNRLQGL
ncbi:MAG: PqiC family protein [Halomonas sp.]|uniref:PqiC family protein n=1 Tax=Halomonas sp. TaxID=1486246 RepID=UPI003F929240